MTSSLHTRAYPSASFPSPGIGSRPNHYGAASMRADQIGEQQGLFPPPIPAQMASTTPSETSRPNDNIMNRRGDSNSSLYQICLNLRKRMAEVPGFEVHMLEMEEEEAEANDSTDPVTSMWNCLRRGYPLMTIYNALKPRVPLEVDASRLAEAKLGKAATFKFLQACLTDLKFRASECFLITDLYGGDTTGFVKVTRVVNRVLDLLDQRGLLLHTESQSRIGDLEETPPLTYRQNVVKEIVTSERDYIQFLETLQNFRKELEEWGTVAGDVLHDIFLNLNALLDFQRRFLIRIEQQNSLPESQQNWGQLFIQYKDSFRVYEPFIANQLRCNNAVIREWDKIKSTPLSPLLRGIAEVPSVLMGFLLKPFQRLSKYPMLLEDLRRKGGLDEERKQDLADGMLAATSILSRANEAIAKEHRLAAVSELQSRVEDWKGHQIDHFGDLLLFGDYTVVKGEGAKEVEREVRIRVLFDALTSECRLLVSLATDQALSCSSLHLRALVKVLDIQTPTRSKMLHTSTPNLGSNIQGAASRSPGVIKSALRSPGLASPHTPKRFTSGLAEVPEEGGSTRADEKPQTRMPMLAFGNEAQAGFSASERLPLVAPTPMPRSQRPRVQISRMSKRGLPTSPAASPNTVKRLLLSSSLPSSHDGQGSEGGSAPPTPSRRSRGNSSGRLADFSSKVKLRGRTALRGLLKSSRHPADPSVYQYLLFNGPVTNHSELHFLKRPEPTSSEPKIQGMAKRLFKPPPLRTTERDYCCEHKLTSAVHIQYKVYLFERILLCCKEINPNKPKNKMLGNNKTLTDKKGKLRLQLKGRIFMQNVTDVVTTTNPKSEKTDYKIQIFWKGDPGVENFVIRFLNEVDMNTWRDQVQAQKKTLTESARSSGQAGTSETEFLSMKDQPSVKNPYLEEPEEDDSQTSTLALGSSTFNMSRNASSNSLRSAGAQINGSARGPPPRFPMPEPTVGAAYQPPLSLQTNLPPGSDSPGEFGGNSYFSPGGDSPLSTRSSSQASMYAFPRQTTPRLSNEDSKHKTAPAMARAPSRDGTRPMNGYTIDGRTVMRPSLPAMAGPQNAQQQLAMTQSRLRSASTPDIQPGNGNGSRRYANGQLQPNLENVPVPPIPSHVAQMRGPIARSQTSSPSNGALPTRHNTQSPMYQRDRMQRQTSEQTSYDHQMQQRLQAIPHAEPRRYQEGTYADASLQVMNSSPAPATMGPSDTGINYPTQLKVKIRFDPAPSHVTIVVPIIIKHRSLVDRIDSKMTKISSASISKDTARLRYKDEDGDYITIKTDEDVQIAIDDWGKSNEESIGKLVYPDFELFWQPLG